MSTTTIRIPQGRPISPRQAAFLTKLIVDNPEFAAEKNYTAAAIAEFSSNDASFAIAEILAAAKAADPTFRWIKYDGEWLVTGPPGKDVGDTITITKASGDTVEAVITSDAGTARDGSVLHRVTKAAVAPRTPSPGGPLPDVPEGYYAVASGGHNDLLFVRVDRPEKGKWAGRTFLKMVVGGHPDSPIRDFARVRSILDRIIDAGVEAAAQLYGQEIGRCSHCNRHLTDEISRQLGIGPTCRKGE